MFFLSQYIMIYGPIAYYSVLAMADFTHLLKTLLKGFQVSWFPQYLFLHLIVSYQTHIQKSEKSLVLFSIFYYKD